ncbi:MAG: hypothetical protein AB8G95_19440 [Anaerolineae bacterium]
MIKKQFFIGNYGETKIFFHISLPVAAILAWVTISTIMLPAMGSDYGLVVNGLIGTLALAALLIVTLSYDFGRLVVAESRDRKVTKLLLLPISSLLITENPLSNPKGSMASSLLPSLPLIALAASFSLISLSPTAEPMQVAVLQQLSAFTMLFTIARLMGAFALDRTNLLHSSLWLTTKHIKFADFVFQVGRNFSIVALLFIAVYTVSTYQWIGIALAITIALGLQDAIFYRRNQQKRLHSIRKKFRGESSTNQLQKTT